GGGWGSGAKARAAGSIAPPADRTTRRRGGSAPARRTVRRGSSTRTVAAPTHTASCANRNRRANLRAEGLVIQVELPRAAAILPSSDCAALIVTHGLRRSCTEKKGAFRARASASSSPISTA